MSENGAESLVWSEEHDCVPLKLRLKSLLAKKQTSGFSYGIQSRKYCEKTSTSPFEVVKNEDRHFNMQNGHAMKVSDPACFALEEGNVKLPQEISHDGLFGEVSCLGTNKNEQLNSNEIKLSEVADTVPEEKVNPCLSTLPPCTTSSKCSGEKKVNLEDNKLRNPVENGVECSLVLVGKAAKTETEISDDFLNELDHIVLKERRRLLLTRKVTELTKSVSEENYSSLSKQTGSVMIRDIHGKDKKEYSSSLAEFSYGDHTIREAVERNSHGNTTANGESNIIHLSKTNSVCGTAERSSIVKNEPMEYDGVLGLDQGVRTFISNHHMPVKSEFPEDSNQDKVDHMLLSDRIKLLASKETTNVSRGFKSTKKIMPSVLDSIPIASESTPSLKINRSRKRRKTVTDSIETAMEEDAPGLLKVLIDKGVLVSEIKLYGVGENNAASDDSLEESFSDLEAVMSKILFQRQSFLKLGHMRCMKGEKPSYCLACLVSLVEQARYLQFRKWPVEWGWCRDLQSFIFVFKRHHRIVLERPEYGYATYFFELVDSLAIDWQIKRLVTAMRLTSCGRITLIENRSLLVGEDLTEGEARVLMDYGWTPSTGLGTMLSYRDRVVHDRRNESDSLEWKSKIGKLLMDGYNGGTFISPEIPKKAAEFSGAEDFQVKLEI